ncbi:MAG: porin [Alphaproteobacteria bacterium]|nr:MAG: porin [Alphaproteobacteria bacterium]
MRKILLATTALVGVALYGGTAAAQQQGLQVTMGGYTEFRAGFFDESRRATSGTLVNGTSLNPPYAPGDAVRYTRGGTDFDTEWKLNVDAKGKSAEYNVEYGAHVDLTNTPSATAFNSFVAQNGTMVHTDQAYVWVSGKWGKALMGDEHGASDLFVTAPTVGTGQTGNGAVYTNYLNPGTVFAISPSYIDSDENSTKITYYTPKLGNDQHKVQFGASYAPNAFNRGQQVSVFRNQITNGSGSSLLLSGPAGAVPYENMLEFGGKYEGQWSKVGVLASFQVIAADDNNKYTLNGVNTARDFVGYGLGAQATYAGFTLGGSWYDPGRYMTIAGQNKDQSSWTIGGKYEYQKAAVAVSYLSGEGYGGVFRTLPTPANPHDNYVKNYQAVGVGATYSLFPGFVTGVDAVFFDQDHRVIGHDNDGHVVVLSQRVNF